MASTCTLLIVDDCAEDREVCRRYLQKDPHQLYRILEADSAEGGLTLFQEKAFDAILLDFCMPTMNGLEFLTELRQRNLAVPVILLTGHGAEDVAVQAMKMGVQDYLSKQQLNPDMLQLTVRNVIQHWQTQIQLRRMEQRQRFTHTVALHMRQSLSCDRILQQAVTDFQQLLECEQVAIYQPLCSGEVDLVDLTVLTGWTKRAGFGLGGSAIDWLDQWVDSLPDRSFQPPLQLVQPPIQPPIQPQLHAASDPHSTNSPWQGSLTSTQLLLPIVQRSSAGHSTLWGILVARQTAERRWQGDEVVLLGELIHQLALAIQQAEQFEQMQAALEQVKHHNLLKSQMVATVSQSYRSPLSVILAAASTLKSHQLDQDQQQHWLSVIENKARLMAHLVEGLSVVEKLELGQVQFQPLPFNLLEFVADLVEQQRHVAGDRHELIFQISGNAKGFWGDQDLLRQILINLLTNAIKFSPDGGSVTLHLKGEASRCVFLIQDQGMGIPLADQETVFQSFKRGGNVEMIPGTGLGLTITQACVDLHGGEISLNSIEGLGTTVTVVLPKRAR